MTDRDEWYTDALSPAEKKYCRCIAEVKARALAKSKMIPSKRAYSPYAICNKSISRAHGIDPRNLAILSTSGKCTSEANFEKWPSEMMYAWASGRRELKEPSRERDELLRQLNEYKYKLLKRRTPAQL